MITPKSRPSRGSSVALHLATLLLLLGASTAARSQALQVNPPSLSWSHVVPGTTQQQQFSLTNNTASTISGHFDSLGTPFSVLEGTTFRVDAGASSTYTLVFAPTDSKGGALFDTLVMAEDGSNATLARLNVVGVWINIDTAHMQISNTKLDFGTVPVGGYDTLRFTLTNPTPASQLNVNVSSSVNLPFQVIKGAGPHNLRETPLTVSVLFAPYQAGTFDDALVITSNDQSQPRDTVFLHGVATANGVSAQSEPSVQLYPTIVRKTLHVSVPEADLEQVTVFDEVGHPVLTRSYQHATEAEVDLSSASSGIYLLETVRGGGVQRSRVVVQH